VSSPKENAKSSVNQQIKAGLSAVRDFLAGRSGEVKVAATKDEATRALVAAELLSSMSGRGAGEAARANAEASGSDTQEIRQDEAKGPKEEAPDATTKHDSPNATEQERERARKLFVDHGYFDDAVQDLRAAKSAANRAAAARALGLVGGQRASEHLMAAMFDDDAQVRNAVEEALDRIGNLTEANVQVDAVLVELELGKGKLAQPGGQAVGVSREEVEAQSAKAVVDNEGGRDDRSPREEVDAAALKATSAEKKAPIQSGIAQPAASDVSVIDSVATSEEQLLLKENRIRETMNQLQRQVAEASAARTNAEQEAQQRTERETTLRAEAAARRSKEEQLRRRAEEEAKRRATQEREAVMAEQAARTKAESEARRFAEEETSLRLKSDELRLAAEKLARQRGEIETARHTSAEAARLAEATRARDEAKSRYDVELTRLRGEEETLRAKTNEIAARQAEVEAAREQADADAQRLVEAQVRMSAAEEARAQAEVARAQLETEINQRVETAERQLEETRRRGHEEQQRLQEETRKRAEAEQQRLADLEDMKIKAEAESKQLAEKEQQILSEVNSVRIADAETRKRIEEAEVRRRAAEDAYRLVAEKVQRVEAEAHARAKEEEQMVRKLEAERRTVAVEAQSRTDQEKRIRSEIEMFRRLEEQERPRLEAAILQRAEAEARLEQLRERFRSEEEARVSAEEELTVVEQYNGSLVEQPVATDWQTSTSESGTMSPETTSPDLHEASRVDGIPGATEVSSVPGPAAGEVSVGDIDSGPVSGVTPAIAAYLNSVDPYKRAAAVAELARSRPQDAFTLIANCFDDRSPHVRNAAARALYALEPQRVVDLFNSALEDASPERRRNIGSAIAASGLAAEVIDVLGGESREETYNALCLLLTMAKTGEVQPLVQAIEGHESVQVRMAAIKLLTLTGQSEIANAAAKRRLEGH